MTILCLCREQHHWKLIPGYAAAFRRRGIEFFCVHDSIPFDAPLEDVLRTCPATPSAVFHPGYEERFKRAGHPGAFLLPHAVRKDLFEGLNPHREFEIAWIGQTCGEFYKTRAQWLPKLAKEFRSNDWSRQYSIEEVAN